MPDTNNDYQRNDQVEVLVEFVERTREVYSVEWSDTLQQIRDITENIAPRLKIDQEEFYYGYR